MIDRLSASDWISHGLKTLARDGPGALKVMMLAASLKVSRGSFYWHFRDIADFRSQVLRSWQERATGQVIEQLEAENPEQDRLRHLLKRAFVSERSLERAMRSWAAEDEDAAAAVSSVDARRVAYITGLLAASGVEGRLAPHRAAFLYWAYLGQTLVMDAGNASIEPAAVEDIAALFES